MRASWPGRWRAGRSRFGSQAGEWIFAPANTFHLIEVLGEQPAIRIAITPAGEYHRHERADAPPAPPGALQ